MDDGDTTKRELTAALVSSIVESAALSGGGEKTGSNDNKTNSDEKDESDAAKALGKRKTLTSDGQDVQKEDVVSKLPCEDDSSAQHVTPPASATSSFSSIEAAETNQISSESTATTNEQTKSASAAAQ